MVIGPHHRLFHRSTALLWARHLKCDSNDPPRRASGAGRRYHAGHFGLQRPPLAGAPLLHRLPGHSEDQGALGRGLQAPGGMKHLSKLSPPKGGLWESLARPLTIHPSTPHTHRSSVSQPSVPGEAQPCGRRATASAITSPAA
jgi:hypothetical protein